MIDFGLVALFAVQLAIVAVTYHACMTVKKEADALKSERKAVDALGVRFDGLAKLVAGVEEAPKAFLKRLTELEANQGKADSGIDRLQGLFDSANGRISALQRERKKEKPPAEETDPAPQGEDGEHYVPASPGSFPQEAEERGPAIPRGFGKVRRFA